MSKTFTRLATMAAAAATGVAALGAPALAAETEPQSFARAGSAVFVKNNTASSGVADLEYVIDSAHTGLLAGDWDGDGADSLAYRSWSDLYFHNKLGNFNAQSAHYNLSFGSDTDETVAGDFNGDGRTDIALRRASTFILRTHIHLPNMQTSQMAYGKPGDDLFVGDWNGDGADTFAVRRGNHFHIKNSISGGEADKVISYGRAGDEVFVGDWDGDGIDTLAVRRGNHFHIKDSIASGVADRVISYGRAGDELLVGDWDGDGTDSFIVRRPFTLSSESGSENVTKPVDPIDPTKPAPAPSPTLDPNSLEAIKRNYNGRMNITFTNKYAMFGFFPNGEPQVLGFLPKSQYDSNKNYAVKANWPADWFTTDYNNSANWPADLFR